MPLSSLLTWYFEVREETNRVKQGRYGDIPTYDLQSQPTTIHLTTKGWGVPTSLTWAIEVSA